MVIRSNVSERIVAGTFMNSYSLLDDGHITIRVAAIALTT